METLFLGMAALLNSTMAQSNRPALDKIILCKAGDSDWANLLERPWRSDLLYRDHYSNSQNEHANAFPRRSVSVLGARLISIYTANGQHEDGSSHAVLRGAYNKFLLRARIFYGSNPKRVRRIFEQDGPAFQDRFTFKSDGLTIGARFARLSHGRIDVRCRYEG